MRNSLVGTGMMTETFFSGNQGNQQTTTATSNGILVILVPQIQSHTGLKNSRYFQREIPHNRFPSLKLPPFSGANLLFSFRDKCLRKSSPSYTIKPDTLVSWIPMSTFCLVKHLGELLRQNYHPQSINWHQLPLDPKRLKNEDFRPVEYELLWVVTPKSEGCRFPRYRPKKTNSTYHFSRFPSLTSFQSFLGRIEGLRLIGLCASFRSFMSRSSSDLPRARDAMLHSRIHWKARFFKANPKLFASLVGLEFRQKKLHVDFPDLTRLWILFWTG